MKNFSIFHLLLSCLILFIAFNDYINAFAADDIYCKSAVYRDTGASEICAFATYEILNKSDKCKAEFVSAEEIQNGALDKFDVVFFPGGTASMERATLGEEGWKQLKSFLRRGGGYVGTCAGAYMALVNAERAEGRLIDAELQEGEWERGEAILEIELTEEGKKVLGGDSALLKIAYQNGSVFHPANYEILDSYRVLAFFRTEIAENGAPRGVQVGSPAIAVGEFAKGRVIVVSPHPELTPNLHYFLPRIACYAAQK